MHNTRSISHTTDISVRFFTALESRNRRSAAKRAATRAGTNRTPSMSCRARAGYDHVTTTWVVAL